MEVEGLSITQIGRGMLIFLGMGKSDEKKDCQVLSEKIVHLRIFDDELGKMNLSSLEIKAEILVVSQFTLYGDCRKGRRPDFDEAMRPDQAKLLYEYFIERLSSFGLVVRRGRFQESMQVRLVNDGPATFILESKK